MYEPDFWIGSAMTQINYVVACWAGPRRYMHPLQARDRQTFLKLHVQQLTCLEHKYLAQITIVVNDYPDAVFDAYVDSLNGKVFRDVPVRVIRRPNRGMSYGAWSEAFAVGRDNFTHYIWIEDDYLFVHKRFDEELLQMMQISKCDYLCGLVSQPAGMRRHAAISNGIVSSHVLNRVWNKYGILPHAHSANYTDNEAAGQIGMSQAIIDVGGKLGDFTEFGWSVPFSELGRIKIFGDPTGLTLIEPAENMLKHSTQRK